MSGFADLHNHQFAYLGFGGVAFHGRAFGPLNEALPWCDFSTAQGHPAIHGAGGLGDVMGNVVKSELHGGGFLGGILGGHTVGGYPKFDGWPRWDSVTHQVVHQEMLERAVAGGLRLLVVLAVNSQYFASKTARHPLGTDDMGAVDRQIAEAWRMQEYIDKLHGGPGKGWYRISTRAEEADEAISAGKLAVILGVEVDHLFGSREPSTLSESDVVDNLQRYHERGVRHVLPIHFSNNAFGGCSFDKPLQNSQYERALGIPLFSPYALDVEVAPTQLGYAYGLTGPPGLRNVRGLTGLGKFLVDQAMDLGWIVDIDHMSNHSKEDAFSIAERRGCPVVSGHTGFVELSRGAKRHEGQLTLPEVRRIVNLGGMVAPIIRQGSHHEIGTFRGGRRTIEHTCGGTSETFLQAYLYAAEYSGGAPVGIGTDFNGFAGSLAPRFGPDGCHGGGNKSSKVAGNVAYPFQLDGFSLLDRSRLAERVFDYNKDGLAHIGMIPDLIADMRAMGLTEDDLNPLMSSADGYVAMWHKIQKQSRFGSRPEKRHVIAPAISVLNQKATVNATPATSATWLP